MKFSSGNIHWGMDVTLAMAKIEGEIAAIKELCPNVTDAMIANAKEEVARAPNLSIVQALKILKADLHA